MAKMYISSNRDNYQRFQRYLASIKVIQNLLFLIELTQYKLVLSKRLNMKHTGYNMAYFSRV